MIPRYFLLLLISILFIFSCQDETKEKLSPLRFDKENIVKRAGENCDSAPYDCTIISLEVLQAKGSSKVSNKINQTLREHVISIISSEENPQIKDLEELTDNFILEYQIAASEFSQEPPWEAYLTESIYRKDSILISIGITTEIFSGGAHGYRSLQFINFDPHTGSTLSWRDIFKPGFKEYAEKKFRNEQEIPEGANINSTGFWFDNDTFHLPENIGFTNEHVILVYNAYEIAPYAAGDFYMEIPLKEVRPFLKIQ